MIIMFQSRFFTISHLLFQNGKRWCDFLQCQQVRHRKLIYPLNDGQIKVLMDIFGVRYRKAYGISRQHTNLRTIDQVLLYKSVAMLHRFGMTKEDFLQHPQLISIQPLTIENYAMLLQEGGFTSIRPNHLMNSLIIMRKPVKLFKLYNYIPEDIKVHENFFTHLKNPPPPLEVDFTDDTEFCTMYLSALSHYLCWRLEMSKEDFERLLVIYPRMKRRSFRLMESSLDILENKLGFTKEKIKRHGYLIHSNPQNLLNILDQVTTLGGLDLKIVLQKYPKIVMMSAYNLVKVEQHLQEFGIPNSAIQRCLEVYTLSSETVSQRLNALKTTPEFMGLITNPRVLSLVQHQHKAYDRLNHLGRINFRCASLHILQSSDVVFEKFLRDGSDRTQGNDVVIYLSTELDNDKEDIRKAFHRHPFWCNIPLVTVLETLNFLRSKGFTKDQIMKNIQILIYSSKQVKKQLEDFPYHPELRKEILRRQKLENRNDIEFTPEQQLALCLYFIEREHHFSGDGVWLENPYIPTTDDVA